MISNNKVQRLQSTPLNECTTHGLLLQKKSLLQTYQIEKKCHPLHGAILFKIAFEESGCFHVDSHSRKYNTEVILSMLLLKS